MILLVLLLSLIMPLKMEDREGNEPFHSFPKKNSYFITLKIAYLVAPNKFNVESAVNIRRLFQLYQLVKLPQRRYHDRA